MIEQTSLEQPVEKKSLEESRKELREQRSDYISQRKSALLTLIHDPQHELNQLITKSDLYNSPHTSEETKSFYLDRCIELIAQFEFGVAEAAKQMQRVPVNPETPWKVIDEDVLLGRIFYKWGENEALAENTFMSTKHGEEIIDTDSNVIFLNLARITHFVDETYTLGRGIGGSKRSMPADEIAFFAGVEEAAHCILVDVKGEKKDVWSYPIPDPQKPEKTYYYANSAEFRALVWKASFEFKLGVNYGFKERLLEARDLIRQYEEQSGIKRRQLA